MHHVMIILTLAQIAGAYTKKNLKLIKVNAQWNLQKYRCINKLTSFRIFFEYEKDVYQNVTILYHHLIELYIDIKKLGLQNDYASDHLMSANNNN